MAVAVKINRHLVTFETMTFCLIVLPVLYLNLFVTLAKNWVAERHIVIGHDVLILAKAINFTQGALLLDLELPAKVIYLL